MRGGTPTPCAACSGPATRTGSWRSAGNGGYAPRLADVVDVLEPLMKLLPVNAVMTAVATVLGRDHGSGQRRRHAPDRHEAPFDARSVAPAPEHQRRDRIDHAIERHQQIRQQPDT